jgi:hypothetical protein
MKKYEAPGKAFIIYGLWTLYPQNHLRIFHPLLRFSAHDSDLKKNISFSHQTGFIDSRISVLKKWHLLTCLAVGLLKLKSTFVSELSKMSCKYGMY